ncbi:MAG TPA: hypothetical protein VLK58_14085 [Conexibacter sp.]|nr:hypothetical protein [Conexibacter sp.]
MGVHASGGDVPAHTDVATGAEPHLSGWVVFAGTMLAIVGSLNIIYGIAAISDSTFYVNDAAYVISGLNTWGWIALVLGCGQMLCAFGVWVQNGFAVWAGVAFAGLNAIAQLLMLPAYPFLSLALFAVDLLVIYALAVHGTRRAELT